MTSDGGAGDNLSRGYALAVVSAAILSTTAIFIRYLTQTYRMPALVLALWRDGLVALTVLPVLWRLCPARLRVGGRHLPYLAAYGFVLASFNGLWVLSVALNGAAVTSTRPIAASCRFPSESTSEGRAEEIEPTNTATAASKPRWSRRALPRWALIDVEPRDLDMAVARFQLSVCGCVGRYCPRTLMRIAYRPLRAVMNSV